MTAGATGEINNNPRYYHRIMAKRNYSTMKRNKIEPAVLTMTLATPTVPGTGVAESFMIDLSQIASLMNRRFYRQGINWAVAGFKFLTAPGYSGQIAVNKLPNTWVLSNAWEKSMRHYLEMTEQALTGTESIRPRFMDFKVYADARHHAVGYAANLLPVSVGDGITASLATEGEWISSKISVPNTASPGTANEFELIAVGASYPGVGASGNNAVSMIEGYAASRGLPYPEDPNVPADAADVSGTSQPQNWIGALTNEGTRQDEQILDNLIDENNQAPYPFEGDGTALDTMYPGGANQLVGMEIHSIENVTGTTIGGTTRIKGGNFPCGLVNVTAVNNGEAASITIQIDLIPGSHRGYLCEPMTEM